MQTPFTNEEQARSIDADGSIVRRLDNMRSVIEQIDLLEYLEDELWVLGADMQLLYVNRRNRENLVGRSALDLIPPRARESIHDRFALAWQDGVAQSCQLELPDGKWSQLRLAPVVDRRGGKCMLVTLRDITARKRAEATSKELEMHLSSALEASGIGSWSWSVVTGAVVWDARMCEISGRSERPKSYAAYLETVHPEDLERVKEVIEGSLVSGRFEEFEHRIVRPSGEVRHLQVRAMVVVDAHGTAIGLRGGVFDITDRKLLEERLRNVERLGAMGRLSAGIAHNFNNLLCIIIPSTELCRSAPPDVAAHHLDDIQHAAERAAEMVRQLMQVGRHELGAPKRAVELQTIVSRLINICRTTFESRIAIECDMPASPPLQVLASAGEIEQVLLNICINAREAVMSTQRDAPAIRVEVGPGTTGFMRIRISDNGPGMRAEVSARIFEPFFTTKGGGSSAGLNLASAYGIVSDHGGTITCDSEVGRGTTFTIELPVASEPAREKPRERASSPGIANTETILLVDDELALRKVFRIILEQAGFQVLEAPDGVAGLELIERRRDEIDLVLLDRSMPRMSGEQVLSEMRRRGIQLPVIILTGYEGNEPIHETASAVLHKPVSTGELVTTIRSILDLTPKHKRRA